MGTHDRKIILGLSCLVFILQYGYLLIPEDNGRHQPFPFYEYPFGGITWQVYYDYIFNDIGVLIMFYMLSRYIPALREKLFIFWVLWCGYTFEYVICYNQPFAHLWIVPISYSLFAGLAMIGFFGYELLKK